MITQAEVGAALNTLKVVADTIKELGSVPSGHLYARLMGVMDLATYEKIIALLVKSTIITEQNHLLTWNVTE
jgi:hypothetical protein